MRSWLRVWNPWLTGLAAVLAAANVLVASYLFWPTWQARGRMDDQLHDLQRSARTVQQEVRSSQAMLQAIKETDEFATGYPSRRELVAIVGRVTELAKSLALQVPDITYQPTTLKDVGLVKVDLRMGVEGSYAKIRRFLYELEGIRRYLVVERMALHDVTGTSALQVALTLAVYVR